MVTLSHQLQVPPSTAMSLALGYSSGEDDASIAKDAFGLAHLPFTKKVRIESVEPTPTPDAAPDVLSEVRFEMCSPHSV